MGTLNISPMTTADLLERVKMSLSKYERPVHTLTLEEESVDLKISEIAKVKALLTDLRSKITAASTAFNPTLNLLSSNTSVATVSTLSNTLSADNGTHTLNVTQLAKAQSTASTVSFTAAQTMSADTMTITMGSNNFAVNIEATDTLQDVINKINSDPANVGVTASSISTDGTNYQLILTSKQTGANQAFTVSESLGSPQFDVSQVIYAAHDAEFTLDGVFSMTRSSNTITDVIPGVSIQLISEGGSTTISVNKDADKTSASAKSAIQGVLDSYNLLMYELDVAQANGTKDPVRKYTDESDKNAGSVKRNESVLVTTNDPLFTQIKNMLEQGMHATNADVASYKTVESLGIVTGSAIKFEYTYDEKKRSGYTTGNMEIYKNSQTSTDPINSLLDNALKNDMSDVNELFFGTNGIFSGLASTIDNDIMLGTAGVIDKRLNGYAGLKVQKSDIEDKIQEGDDYVEEMRLKLVDKYANLNMILAQFEYTSKYLEAQFDSMRSDKK